MSQYPAIFAGEVITASLLQAFAPFFASKTIDQSVTSSTVLVNDTALSLPVAASATYFFVLNLSFEGGTTGSSDLKWGWTFPSGLTMRYTQAGNAGNALTATMGGFTQATSGSNATNGAGNLQGLILLGTVTVSSTAGTLQFQWAQHTSSGTATIVHAGSVLGMWRIS